MSDAYCSELASSRKRLGGSRRTVRTCSHPLHFPSSTTHVPERTPWIELHFPMKFGRVGCSIQVVRARNMRMSRVASSAPFDSRPDYFDPLHYGWRRKIEFEARFCQLNVNPIRKSLSIIGRIRQLRVYIEAPSKRELIQNVKRIERFCLLFVS